MKERERGKGHGGGGGRRDRGGRVAGVKVHLVCTSVRTAAGGKEQGCGPEGLHSEGQWEV